MMSSASALREYDNKRSNKISEDDFRHSVLQLLRENNEMLKKMCEELRKIKINTA